MPSVENVLNLLKQSYRSWLYSYKVITQYPCLNMLTAMNNPSLTIDTIFCPNAKNNHITHAACKRINRQPTTTYREEELPEF
jgi:hypothetical protein